MTPKINKVDSIALIHLEQPRLKLPHRKDLLAAKRVVLLRDLPQPGKPVRLNDQEKDDQKILIRKMQLRKPADRENADQKKR